MRTPAVLLALICCVCGLLVGCWSSGSAKTRAAHHLLGEMGWLEGQAMRDVVDRFNQREQAKADENQSYVPIYVDMVQVSRLDQKLLVAVAGGNPPDVAGAWTWLVYSYSEKGATH